MVFVCATADIGETIDETAAIHRDMKNNVLIAVLCENELTTTVSKENFMTNGDLLAHNAASIV